MNVLVLRYSGYWYGPLLARAPQLYLVATDAEVARIPRERLAAFRFVYRTSSYDSLEELSAVAADLDARGVRIDRIASPTEYTQYAAGYLGQLLNVPHLSVHAALGTRDKRVMKRWAQDAGLAVPRWFSVPALATEPDADEVIAATGLPLVLKPANGWGATSTTRIDDRDQLAAALSDYAFDDELRSHHLIAEEFVDGVEMHIDAVWHDGTPWLFTVSRYFKPLLRQWNEGGLNGSFVLPRHDHPDLYRRLLKYNTTLNKALGVVNGATHLESFIEASSGRILLTEMASRLAGGNLSEMIGAHCGVDLREVWAHELVDGAVEDLLFREGDYPYVGMLNLTPSISGTITELPDELALNAHPNVIAVSNVLAVGDLVSLTNPSSWCTMLVIGAETEDALVAAAEELNRTFVVRVA